MIEKTAKLIWNLEKDDTISDDERMRKMDAIMSSLDAKTLLKVVMYIEQNFSC